MTSISFIFSMLLLTVAAMGSAHAQSSTGAAVMVGVDNFARAETDLYMGKMVLGGSLGKFAHSRAPADIATQDVVRMNRDTLYFSAVHSAADDFVRNETALLGATSYVFIVRDDYKGRSTARAVDDLDISRCVHRASSLLEFQ